MQPLVLYSCSSPQQGVKILKSLLQAALAQGLPRRVAACKCPAARQAAKDLLPNIFLCTSGETPSISPPEVKTGLQDGQPMILTESRTAIQNITTYLVDICYLLLFGGTGKKFAEGSLSLVKLSVVSRLGTLAVPLRAAGM